MRIRRVVDGRVEDRDDVIRNEQVQGSLELGLLRLDVRVLIRGRIDDLPVVELFQGDAVGQLQLALRIRVQVDLGETAIRID